MKKCRMIDASIQNLRTHFQRIIGNAGLEPWCPHYKPKKSLSPVVFSHCSNLPTQEVAPVGAELSAISPKKTAIPQTGGTYSGTLPDDSDLRALLLVWPRLTPKERRQLVVLASSMVK